MELKWAIDAVLREAEQQGSWAEFAVWCMGESYSGDKDLDKAIEELYAANERVHYIANKLALRYDLEAFGGV